MFSFVQYTDFIHNIKGYTSYIIVLLSTEINNCTSSPKKGGSQQSFSLWRINQAHITMKLAYMQATLSPYTACEPKETWQYICHHTEKHFNIYQYRNECPLQAFSIKSATCVYTKPHFMTLRSCDKYAVYMCGIAWNSR